MKTLLLALLLFVAGYSTKIASGSYTVGTTGADYSSWQICADSVAATLTGNLTLTQIDTTLDTAHASFGSNLAGYTLTIQSNKSSKGCVDSGWIAKYTGATNYKGFLNITASSTVAGAKVVVKNMNIKIASTSVAQNWVAGIHSAVNDADVVTIVNDCIVNQNVNSKKVFCYVFGTGVSATKIQMYNCVGLQGGVSTGTQYDGRGVWLGTTDTSSRIENCTFYGFSATSGVGFYNYSNSKITVKNVASFNCTYADYAYGPGASKGQGAMLSERCASSDTTGNVGFKSLSAMVQFVDTATNSVNLFKVRRGAVLDTGGVAPALAANTTGIRGNTRPNNLGLYSIGADNVSDTALVTYGCVIVTGKQIGRAHV